MGEKTPAEDETGHTPESTRETSGSSGNTSTVDESRLPS